MIIWIRAALQLFAVAILSTSSHQVITSSLLLLWYLLSFVYMLSLTLVCIHASVLITVCHPFPSEISGQFIDTTSTTGSSGGGSDSGGSTFLLQFLLGNRVLITIGDLDRLCRL